MSIMTTSTGKTLKRKQEDEIVTDEVALSVNEPEKKKTALTEKSEITITPIPKEIKEPEAQSNTA